MRLDLQATVAKRLDEPNEDVCGTLPFRHRYALSDGATESFAPRQWAQVVVQAFLDRQAVDRDWICRASARYARGFDRVKMSWIAQAAFDRGSFATLLGLTLDPGRRTAQVLGIGDSLAILGDSRGIQAKFPYQTAIQFRQRPLLLASHLANNARLLAPGAMAQATVQWSLRGLHDPVLLLVTDALGAWLLSDPAARWERLLRLRNRVQFDSLVRTERACGQMRRDDTTLLRIR